MNKTILALAISLFAAASAEATVVTHFQATLTSSEIVLGGAQISTETSTATANFVLFQPINGEPKLTYELNVSGLDIDGAQTSLDPNDNVTAVHLHDVTQFGSTGWIAGDTAKSLHVLNIYGMPRQDDGNLSVDAVAGTFTGLWDATDENSLSPAPSGKPSDSLTELFNEELFIMIHTSAFPDGAIGGFLVQVPEPASALLMVVGLVVPLSLRRRWS